MRTTIFLGAAAALALIATDPAFCLQSAPTPSADPMQATEPAPAAEPVPTPAPTGEPMAEPMPAPQPSVQGSTDAPVGPMATPPSAGSSTAQSGATTPAMLTPQPATKEYPLCTREIQDSCRNPGEGPKSTRKKR
jgi:hypothetical protein